MRTSAGRLLILFLLIGLIGCGAKPDPVVEAPPPPPPPKPLEGEVDLSLKDLLTKSRLELAQLADESLSRIRYLEKQLSEGRIQGRLLPDLRLPLVVPVLREAKYSEKAGFSLPPYVAEGAADPEVALHLARHGDGEAARKSVDPADKDALARLDAVRLERTYPVEWTRLVALHLHIAEFRTKSGEVEGATELVALQRQLRQLLDEKAAKGPLGAALLGRGRTTLQLAASAWRTAGKAELAEQAEKMLKDWGEPPVPAGLVVRGETQKAVARLLRSQGQGRALTAVNTLRAFDLFGLPLPEQGAASVVCFFAANDRLTEVQVLYGSGTATHFRVPGNLAHALEDSFRVTGKETRSHGVRGAVYQLSGATCDVNMISRGSLASAVVRFRDASIPPTTDAPATPLPREFGKLHLDRSFEQNRLLLAPSQKGDMVQTSKASLLGEVRNPLPKLRLAQVAVQREGSQETTGQVTLNYEADQVLPPLAELALPLWAAWGPGRWEGVEDEHGGHLALLWEDAATRCTLVLPHATGEPLRFVASSRTEPRDVAFDQTDRGARFAAGKLVTRLPRSPEGVPVALGMTREAVKQAVPVTKGVFTRDLPDGLAVVITGDPARDADVVLRQWFVRFDKAGKAAEVRARYVDAQNSGKGTKDMLAGLQKRGGAAETIPASWAAAWTGLPERKLAPVCLRWRDDATLLTWQADAGGAEVCVRDCPVDHPNGVPMPPFTYLGRGPEKIALGDDRAELLRRWDVKEPTTLADGALVLNPPQPGAHEVCLVYFAGDKVARIVARHAQAKPLTDKPAALATELRNAWGRVVVELGWPLRQDFVNGTLAGLGWLDDQTQVRMFWQQKNQAVPQVYTEWRDLTSSPGTRTARP